MSWYFLNPKVKLSESHLHGKGLFAKEEVKKGEIISISGGRTLTMEEMRYLTEEQQNMCYEISDRQFFAPTDFNNVTPDWYVNHSCAPNAGFKNEFTLVAVRDINPGEEITYDYATTDSYPDWYSSWSISCTCGADSCRKILTGDDWRRKELQKRYKGFFLKHIQARIDAMQ